MVLSCLVTRFVLILAREEFSSKTKIFSDSFTNNFAFEKIFFFEKKKNNVKFSVFIFSVKSKSIKELQNDGSKDATRI